MRVIEHNVIDKKGECVKEIVFKEISRMDKFKLIMGILQLGRENVIVLRPLKEDDE